jgi:hypothetical protein
LRSPLAGEQIETQGVVTGTGSKGFFVQDATGDGDDGTSDAIFVYSPRSEPPVGALVKVSGKVVDFQHDPDGNERPTTQIMGRSTEVIALDGPSIEPVWLTADSVPEEPEALALYLNSLEGMLVGIEAGATFVAPSNPFGDYVVLPKGGDAIRTPHGGVIIDPQNPHRWYPGFRIKARGAPQVNVGAQLLSPVIGPLNYRSSSYQIAAQGGVQVDNLEIAVGRTQLLGDETHATFLTLNGFNLDEQVERADRVKDPRRDIDDDVGDGRYIMLANAVVNQAANPDIVALQEIQDNDGAEQSGEAGASENYKAFTDAIRRVGGPQYAWADISPELNADGGQPGGNIRNGFLYNPERMELIEGSLGRIGEDDPAYDDSRKPLIGRFRMKSTSEEIAVINVHLASKRHQNGIFSPNLPGHDPRLETRVRQAKIIRDVVRELKAQGIEYYVTGDFNDFEFSQTLKALVGDESLNMVETLPENERYDYNHRGPSQALMHGIVSKEQAAHDGAQYEVLHGNELIGSTPGRFGDRGSDHALVMTRLKLAARD